MGNSTIPLSSKREMWMPFAGLAVFAVPITIQAFLTQDRSLAMLAIANIVGAFFLLLIYRKNYKSRQGYVFAWDDTHLWLAREGSEVWRIAWSEIAECKSRNSRPFGYLLAVKNGTELDIPCNPLGCHPLDMLLRVAGIKVSGISGSTSMAKLKDRKPRWLLKNHMRYGPKPNPDGKPVAFRPITDPKFRGARIFQIVFYVLAVVYSLVLFAGLATVFVLETTRRISPENRIELVFVSVFGLLFLATAAFFIRAFMLAIASRQTNSMGLRFDREKVYVVEDDKVTPAQLEPIRIGLLSEYLVVRAGEKRYWFSLLMAQE